jgi:hypothetical protein
MSEGQEFDYGKLADGFEVMAEMFTLIGAQAAALRPKFEAQGWSPPIAEQMAMMAYAATLQASTNPQGAA